MIAKWVLHAIQLCYKISILLQTVDRITVYQSTSSYSHVARAEDVQFHSWCQFHDGGWRGNVGTHLMTLLLNHSQFVPIESWHPYTWNCEKVLKVRLRIGNLVFFVTYIRYIYIYRKSWEQLYTCKLYWNFHIWSIICLD